MEHIEGAQTPIGTISGNYQISHPMPNGVSISFSGYVLDIDDQASLNRKLDDAMAVMQRQARLAAIPQIKMAIDKMSADREQHQKGLNAITAKQERGEKLASQEKTQAENLPVNIRAISERIEMAQKELASLEAEVNA